MNIGCTTATFGGKLPDKLAAMRAAGFVATELWPRDLFEHAEGPDVAIRALRENGLAISAYQALRNFEGAAPEHRTRNLAIASQLFDQMTLLGAETLVLCSNTDNASSGDRLQQIADLRVLGDLASSFGMRVAYEPLCWARWVADYRTAWELIRETDHPAVGLLLDSFHIFARDDALDDIATIPGDRIFLVEIADIPRANLNLIELSRAYRLFPGEGVAPVREFIEQVSATGYRGVYSVEIFNALYATQAPEIIANRAMASMQALLA